LTGWPLELTATSLTIAVAAPIAKVVEGDGADTGDFVVSVAQPAVSDTTIAAVARTASSLRFIACLSPIAAKRCDRLSEIVPFSALTW
jgi:hypothetical protein